MSKKINLGPVTAYAIAVANGFVGTVTEWLASLKGERGEKGDPGAKGEPGTTPNIQIGTVETLDAGSNATASVSGTPENPLLNLGVPKGPPGEIKNLPIATETTLGGVQPVAATEDMMQPVGVNPDGRLYTAPGGGREREWSLLGEIDLSTFGGGGIKLTDLNDFTNFYCIWETPKNESATASGYGLAINGISIASMAIPISNVNNSTANYGWLKVDFDGLVWQVQRSSGAILNTNTVLASSNGSFPFNHVFNIGKATTFTLPAPVDPYKAVSGIIKIYGR